MTEIPVNADVLCLDGAYGKSTDVVVDRATLKVTHFVVQASRFDAARLVPIQAVAGYDAHTIHLNCRKDEVEAFQLFIEREYVQNEELGYLYYPPVETQDWGAPTMIPSLGPNAIAIDHENVPEGEVAVPAGLPVYATDGSIGHVDHLLSDSATGKVSHVVLQHGHLWGKRLVTVPLTAVDHVDAEGVFLKISRAEVQGLPQSK